MGFFHYQQGDSFWDDPVGYALNHQSAPYSSPILGMAQGDFDYYQTNIQPLQQQLLNQAENPATITNAVTQAEGDVATQYAKAPGAFKQQMASQGIVPSAAQTADFNKQNALSAGIATASAANQTRAAVAAQNAGILTGGG